MSLKNLKNMLNGFKIDIKMGVGYIYSHANCINVIILFSNLYFYDIMCIIIY